MSLIIFYTQSPVLFTLYVSNFTLGQVRSRIQLLTIYIPKLLRKRPINFMTYDGRFDKTYVIGSTECRTCCIKLKGLFYHELMYPLNHI